MPTLPDVEVLIDGDPLVYAAGFSAQVTAPDGTVIAPLTHSLHALDLMIKSQYQEASLLLLNNRCNVKGGPKIYLSGPNNFRDKIATIRKYKGNRDPLHKPVHYQALRERMLKTWNAHITDGHEADDELAMRQWQAVPESTIIVSPDKDLLMVPGWHYNPQKKKARVVSDLEACQNFYAQLLSGDPIDNVGGVYGIGKGKAKWIIHHTPYGVDPEAAYFVTALNHYEASVKRWGAKTRYAHLEPEDALFENARLLWMLQEPGQVWQPPNTGKRYYVT